MHSRTLLPQSGIDTASARTQCSSAISPSSAQTHAGANRKLNNSIQ
jgi:hypothetical protein